MKQAAQDGEGKDDVLVFAAFEGVTNEVCDAPDEVDFLPKVVHGPLFLASTSIHFVQ